jgi:hypothetical protein
VQPGRPAQSPASAPPSKAATRRATKTRNLARYTVKWLPTLGPPHRDLWAASHSSIQRMSRETSSTVSSASASASSRHDRDIPVRPLAVLHCRPPRFWTVSVSRAWHGPCVPGTGFRSVQTRLPENYVSAIRSCD